MNWAITSLDGGMFFLRWLHFFFGILWIGHLYYFNFTQGPFFNETDAGTKSNAIQKLVPRALWWFRWGAMWTFVTGLLILGLKGHQAGFEIYTTSWGVAILVGGLYGLSMWGNVWFIIWPAQKIVIASATQVAQGKGALPEAAAAGARAGLASRTNTLMSIPLLFFMGAASHLPIQMSEDSNLTGFWILMFVIWGALVLNGIKGKLGVLTTVKGVITWGFILTAALYCIMEIML